MKRDDQLTAGRWPFAVALVVCVVCFAATALNFTSIREAQAAGLGSPWGDYETAVRGAFMRSEGEAFESVTRAIEDLPEIARDGFVKGIIVRLGLASKEPDSLDGGTIDPERFKRVRDALGGFSNADELLAIIEKQGIEKVPEPVDDSPTEVPVAEPEPKAEPVDLRVVPVVPREPIEPISPVEPRADLRFEDDGSRILYSIDPNGSITIPATPCLELATLEVAP